MRRTSLFTLGMLIVLSIGVGITIEWANGRAESEAVEQESEPVEPEPPAAYEVYEPANQVCGNKVLQREWFSIMAYYCVGEFGEFEINTDHLVKADYDSLIVPMKRAVQIRALRKGFERRW